MSHDAHAAPAAHDAHDASHGHDSHGSHAPAVVDNSPGGWPVALIIGVGYLSGALWAFLAH
jgi:hypothetical protein